MDKGGEVMKRGGGGGSTAKRHINRKQQQSASSVGHNLIIPGGSFKAIRGDIQLSEKSKKEKVRSLSAVAKALSSHEMGCHVSDSQKPNASAVIAAKKFKLPRNKKVFNESNGINHASVPRKIRSAMKKRGRESMLSDSEKVNHKIEGIESPEKDGIKKPKKQESQDWSTRQVVAGTITKDEEEVAETLYALAGMFPNNGSNTESELDCESLPKNSSVLQGQEESTNTKATFQVSGAIEDVNLIPKSSPREAEKISSLNETIGLEQTGFPGSAELLKATHNTALKMNLQAVPMMVRKRANDGKVALHDSDLCLEMGLNVSTQSQISPIGRQPDVEFETAGGIDCKQEQHMMKNQKQNEGPALWPGLSPSASAGNSASYSAAKPPHWLNAAICASKQDSMENCSSGGKVSEVVVHKKSRKRCATHVHISQLIRSLEAVPKRQVAKEPELHECHQVRVHQGSNSGGLLRDAQNSNGTRNGNSSAAGTVHSASIVRNFPETRNGILQKQQYHYLDMSQSQAPPTPGVYGSQKQSFNFLSLSAGGNNGLKVDDSFNKGGSRLEAFSKSQVPYFQSLQQQQHGIMPIPTTQTHYDSTSYHDQLPAAGPQVRLQQPHYYGTPLSGTHYSSIVSYKQQQQSFWAAQLVAAQGGSAVNCNVVRTQYPNWQSGRHDTSAVVSQCGQVMFPHSLASLEAIGSKITSISEQHPFTLASSLPPSSRTNGLDIHLASVCDESSRGRFRSSGTSSLQLQLLCDERI